MREFTVHRGLVAALDRANVDTDAIIPKQFLKSVKRTGFGPNLFDEWRYLDRGEPGMDNARRPLNPDFVLNKARFKGASILLARKNFGCGSSREHAPWALEDYGFRAIIAPSFADIFYNNCFKNGLLPIVLTEAQVDRLFHEVAAFPGVHGWGYDGVALYAVHEPYGGPALRGSCLHPGQQAAQPAIAFRSLHQERQARPVREPERRAKQRPEARRRRDPVKARRAVDPVKIH